MQFLLNFIKILKCTYSHCCWKPSTNKRQCKHCPSKPTSVTLTFKLVKLIPPLNYEKLYTFIYKNTLHKKKGVKKSLKMSIPLRLPLIMSYSKIPRVCLFNSIALHSFIYFGRVGHTLIHCQFPKEVLPSAFNPPYNLFYHYPYSRSLVNENNKNHLSKWIWNVQC